MGKTGAILAALAMASLAGCAGDGAMGSEAIRVENLGEEGGPGPYRFTALVDSDDGRYTWDLGDRLTVASDRTVEHTYDFANSAGNVTVTLRYVKDGTAKTDTVGLRIGSGSNAKPTFVLDAQTDWAEVGEPVRFSAARSTDPDGDRLRYSWSCSVLVPDEKLQKQPIHAHDGAGPYKPPSAGSVTSYKANGSLPEPAQVFSGDLCDALGTGTAPSTDASVIEGTFTKRGKYKLFLSASDGPNPSVSGTFDIFVTSDAERPDPWFRFRLNGTLQGPGSGQLQPLCEQLPQPQQCDLLQANFDLPLPGLVGYLNATYTASAAAGAPQTNNVTWELKRGLGVVATGSAPDDRRTLGPASLTATTYTLRASLKQGTTADVDIEVAVLLNINPLIVY